MMGPTSYCRSWARLGRFWECLLQHPQRSSYSRCERPSHSQSKRRADPEDRRTLPAPFHADQPRAALKIRGHDKGSHERSGRRHQLPPHFLRCPLDGRTHWRPRSSPRMPRTFAGILPRCSQVHFRREYRVTPRYRRSWHQRFSTGIERTNCISRHSTWRNTTGSASVSVRSRRPPRDRVLPTTDSPRLLRVGRTSSAFFAVTACSKRREAASGRSQPLKVVVKLGASELPVGNANVRSRGSSIRAFRSC